MHEGKPSIYIFLDLCKSFDTVNHQLILEALDAHEVHGKTLQLFANYLSYKMQSMRVRNSLSTKKIISWGIPQGTVLEPLLFIIYLTNLLTLYNAEYMTNFAEDAVIICKDSCCQYPKYSSFKYPQLCIS